MKNIEDLNKYLADGDLGNAKKLIEILNAASKESHFAIPVSIVSAEIELLREMLLAAESSLDKIKKNVANAVLITVDNFADHQSFETEIVNLVQYTQAFVDGSNNLDQIAQASNVLAQKTNYNAWFTFLTTLVICAVLITAEMCLVSIAFFSQKINHRAPIRCKKKRLQKPVRAIRRICLNKLLIKANAQHTAFLV